MRTAGVGVGREATTGNTSAVLRLAPVPIPQAIKILTRNIFIAEPHEAVREGSMNLES